MNTEFKDISMNYADYNSGSSAFEICYDEMISEEMADDAGNSAETVESGARKNTKASRDIYTEESVFKIYMRDVAALPVLNQEEEQRLGKVIQEGKTAEEILQAGGVSKEDTLELTKMVEAKKDAVKKMVESGMKLVICIAREYSMKYPSQDIMDLIQEGNEKGLIPAALGFKPGAGTRFSTYATFWIKQAINRFILNNHKAIRLPIHQQETIRKIRLAADELKEKNGYYPSHEEIAAVVGLTAEKVREIRKYEYSLTSLDLKVGDDKDTTLEELVEDSGALSPEEAYAQSETNEILQNILADLPEKESEVLKLRYGFQGRTHTLEEIGKIMGISRERVRQIESNALKRIRGSRSYMVRLEGLC